MTADLTAGRARYLLSYDPNTGVFTRRRSVGRSKAEALKAIKRELNGFDARTGCWRSQ